MALVKGTNARTGRLETVAPPVRAARPARPASEFRPLPQQGRGPVVAAAPAQPVFQVAPAPQPVFQVQAPAPDIIAANPAVPAMEQVFAQAPPVVAAAAEPAAPAPVVRQEGQSPWLFFRTQQPGSNALTSPLVVAPTIKEMRDDTMSGRRADAVAEQYDQMAKMGERDRKRREYEANDRTEKARQLTAEEWAALSPLQQAAAQANSDLAAAVARDRKFRNKATGEQIDSYNARLEELFGDDATLGYQGIEYAPNTLAFIDERGLTALDLAGKSLDDFLSGEAFTGQKVVDALHEKIPEFGKDAMGRNVRGGVTKREQNILFAQKLAQGQLAYQEELASKLAKGDALLTTITEGATNAAAATDYGAQPLGMRSRLDKVRPETQAVIDKYMWSLARTDLDLAESISTINLDLEQRGATEEEAKQVYQAMLDRSRDAMTGAGKWFPGEQFKMRSPQEVAQALGAPTLKRMPNDQGGTQ